MVIRNTPHPRIGTFRFVGNDGSVENNIALFYRSYEKASQQSQFP